MAKTLDRLNQIASAATTLADLTRSKQVYRFTAAPGTYLYVHAAQSEVRIARHDSVEIVITANLQPPVSWRVAADQDDAAVYFVGIPKVLLGFAAAGAFEIAAPRHTHIILRLENVRLTMDSVTDTLDLPGAL
ncbi:MAG: hypothetical protein IPK19_03555 [Chloroflexi bacterium]|nr:hypothetical protein [Chloroflexota bacterium]